jgi:hypothetical protein
MRANQHTITQERLREVLDYDPDTGIFVWKVQLSSRGVVGTVAGCYCKRDGYIRISVDGYFCLAHRLAWFYVTGEWPKGQIDHKWGERSNNRIADIRDATHSQNQQNRHGPQRNNTSGYSGVGWQKRDKRWRARIKVNGKEIVVGYFLSKEEAVEARDEMA